MNINKYFLHENNVKVNLLGPNMSYDILLTSPNKKYFYSFFINRLGEFVFHLRKILCKKTSLVIVIKQYFL